MCVDFFVYYKLHDANQVKSLRELAGCVYFGNSTNKNTMTKFHYITKAFGALIALTEVVK